MPYLLIAFRVTARGISSFISQTGVGEGGQSEESCDPTIRGERGQSGGVSRMVSQHVLFVPAFHCMRNHIHQSNIQISPPSMTNMLERIL